MCKWLLIRAITPPPLDKMAVILQRIFSDAFSWMKIFHLDRAVIQQFMGCVIGRIHMAVRSYSVLDILLPSIIIIVQDYSQALNTYKCLYVFNWPISVLGDWMDISIAHVIIIIKSEVSTFPIVIIFSVVVCLRCLLHHILSLIAYTFRENREFVFIIIVQFMMSANIRIRLACRSYSFACTVHHLIIIIVQTYLNV